MMNKSFSITFGTEIVLKRYDTFIYSDKVINGFYLLTPTMYEIHDTENNRLSLKRKSPSSNPTKLWHQRLGHINLNRIDRLVKDGILALLVVEPMPVCESCLEGIMTKRPFSSKGRRAKDLLELVYTDMYGPINLEREIDMSTSSLSPMMTQDMNTYTLCTASLRLMKSSKSFERKRKSI